MSDLIWKKTTKREFLKILGFSSASLLGSGVLAKRPLANAGSKFCAQTTIYHTSTRKRKSCNACKSHAANRIYVSKQAADLNRAHFGCNCRIVEEKIGWQNYAKAFWPDAPGGGVFYDKRWGWPPPLPAELDLESIRKPSVE